MLITTHRNLLLQRSTNDKIDEQKEVNDEWTSNERSMTETEVIKRCLPGLGHIHYRGATGGVPYPRVDIGKFSNIILL